MITPLQLRQFSCPAHALRWEYRSANLVREIREYDADIICLQEVESFPYFQAQLHQNGFEGVFEPRPSTKHMDGLAIFYKKDKFRLKTKSVIDYNNIPKEMFGSSNHNQYKTHNIALVCEFETIGSQPRTLYVATTHIHWDREMPELKFMQPYTLLKELEKLLCVETNKGKRHPPLVITGDFNARPGGSVYELYRRGTVASARVTNVTDRLLKSAEDLTHRFKLRSAYGALGDPATFVKDNGETDSSVTLDYIWVDRQSLYVNRVLSPITDLSLYYQSLPNEEFSSDHFAIMGELDFKQ